ncbi:hypothetical protein JCM10296v2_001292 [Rhodotorula toruloides]
MHNDLEHLDTWDMVCSLVSRPDEVKGMEEAAEETVGGMMETDEAPVGSSRASNGSNAFTDEVTTSPSVTTALSPPLGGPALPQASHVTSGAAPLAPELPKPRNPTDGAVASPGLARLALTAPLPSPRLHCDTADRDAAQLSPFKPAATGSPATPAFTSPPPAQPALGAAPASSSGVLPATSVESSDRKIASRTEKLPTVGKYKGFFRSWGAPADIWAFSTELRAYVIGSQGSKVIEVQNATGVSMGVVRIYASWSAVGIRGNEADKVEEAVKMVDAVTSY